MIPIYRPFIDEQERCAILEAFDSGWISSKGEFIKKFENSFSKFISKSYGVSVSNGTVALHLALAALGIGKGDEVIVPNLTFAATANAAIYQGASPVFVDVEKENWGLDPELLEKAITSKTKAIIAVHLYGNPCKISEIKEVAEKNDVHLIEDCAEAIGAKYGKHKVGSFGDISCFSFYGNKIITTGEGGMCLTDDKYLEEQMRILRDHGMSQTKRYWHDTIGFNYRMTNIQASIGLAQLNKVEHILERKRNIATAYQDYLVNYIEKQVDPPNSESVFWLYSILAASENERAYVVSKLDEAAIESRPFFFSLSSMPPYKQFRTVLGKNKITFDLSNRGLNLPSFPSISIDQIGAVSDVVNNSIKYFRNL